MAQPLRIEYSGALYHVMARGNQGAVIFADDQDRRGFLATLGEACGKTGERVHAYVLFPNGLVAAGADDGIATLGGRGIGDGPLGGCDSGQPDEPSSQPQAGKNPSAAVAGGRRYK
jgi:hypothetical protein